MGHLDLAGKGPAPTSTTRAVRVTARGRGICGCTPGRPGHRTRRLRCGPSAGRPEHTKPHHLHDADQPRKPRRCVPGRHHELTNASSLGELTWLLSIVTLAVVFDLVPRLSGSTHSELSAYRVLEVA